MSQAAPDFQGTDRFQILGSIGKGGMGVVYKALDRERNMTVALKLLPALEPVALYRFKQEFRALSELTHPNLVSLYELISEGDQWFFTMELLETNGDFFPAHKVRIKPPSSRVTSSKELHPASEIEAMDSPTIAIISQPLAKATATQEIPIDATMELATMVLPVTALPETELPTMQMPAVVLPAATTPSMDKARLDSSLPASSKSDDAKPYIVDYNRVRDVFLQIAEGVCTLHREGKLHRDLKTANVIVCRDGQVKLLDFGLVTNMEGQSVANPARSASALHDMQISVTSQGFISGTLAYMSPEQTEGQVLAPASDWYAVGVMLYEVLTGRVPFHDAGEDFVFYKQNRKPQPPIAKRPETPSDLNDLCMALLSIEAQLRPTGEQVIAALSSEPRETSKISGDEEVVPFIGREKDLQRLRETWRRVAQGSAITLHVHGRSGTGKSSLVRHFLDELAATSAPVILCGRCYEQESVPFKALDSVVDALTQHLMLLRDDEVAELLPEHTGALTRLFPVLSRVQAVADFALKEGQGSFDLRALQQHAFAALRELFLRIANQRGLVVYVDDLQWGDTDSAALLQDLMCPPRAPEMLLLLTYRTEYIGHSACLKALNVEESGQVKGAHNTLALQPLTTEDGLKLALELLGTSNQEQAEWIVRESRGTAFFIYELARYVRTHAQAHTELPADVNLDSVLWQRVSQLPSEAMRLLEFISVAGEPLPLRTIQSAGGLNNLPPQVITQLRSAHLVRTAGPSLDDEIECYHDRVRETVKEHLVADTRRSHHGSLASTLEATGASADKLAPHFEFAGKLDRAAQCYAKAADEAAAALAFNRAEEHYLKAIELTADPVARAAIQEKMIHFYTDTARFPEAYKVTRDAVKTFGISLPPKFIPPLLIGDFLLSKWRMKGLKPADILNHREMTDPKLKAAVSLINAGAKAAYQVRPELCVAISTRAVNLCLQHGITPECAIGWMVYGTIFQGGIMGQHALGYDFGKLALGLIDKFKNDRQRAEVNFVVGYFGTSWIQPAREAEALWRTAWQAGLDSGDLFHTGCAGASLVMSQFMRGLPFDEVLEEADSIMPTYQRASLREPIGVLTAVRQAVRNLRGQTQSPDTFTDSNFDEAAHRKSLANYGSRHFAHLFFILRLQTLYLHGQHEKAADFAKLSADYLKDSPGMLHSAEHHFYAALNAAALATKATGFKRWKLKQQVRTTHKRFAKWATDCAENFSARAHLLAAVLAGVDGQFGSMLTACEAVKQKTKSLPLLALAEHFAASAHHSQGRNAEAESSRKASRDHLAEWGAQELECPCLS